MNTSENNPCQSIYTTRHQGYNPLFLNTDGSKKVVEMKGFAFAGIHAGIKKNGIKDLGLILCEKPATAAAVFTRNQVRAAPVILGQQVIQKGACQAVLVNSGNANCFTGEQGIEDARRTIRIVADTFGIPRDLVMVSSTGVIGAPLPMEKFETGIPQLKTQIHTGTLADFATAILTTDLTMKTVEMTADIETASGRQTIAMKGVAKGSGMIRPDMATMLAYVITDAHISASDLKQALTSACDKTFNRITVDGDTSTNDTLLCLAGGTGNAHITNDASRAVFQSLLEKVCLDLATRIVRDGEGATKLVQITVKGAATKQDAFKAAEAIAHSNLVKTAVYGEDPNWGRITAAAGRSGAVVDPDRMDLFFDTVALVIQGKWQGKAAEKQAAEIMKASEISMTLDLNLGAHTDQFLFCDFSENYIKINADYRS
jgi:glutamate N-acetyltransferase/amino-acid N-acetyltransferase